MPALTPALTIAGVEVAVLDGSWTRLDDETLGEEVRAFDGTLLSTERTPKVQYKGQLLFLTLAEAQTVRALIPLGQQVAVAGALVDTAEQSLTARVKLGTVQPFQHFNGVGRGDEPELYYVADITVREG